MSVPAETLGSALQRTRALVSQIKTGLLGGDESPDQAVYQDIVEELRGDVKNMNSDLEKILACVQKLK